jgi:hypothetical protein
MLEETAQLGSLVRVKRTIRRADVLEGFPVLVGKKWCLIHHFHPEFFLNGYTALRLSDVERVKEFDSDSFHAQAARQTGQVRHVPEGLDLSSTKALLTTARTAFPLITIHIEKDDPDVCFVGVPVSVSDRSLRFLEISPRAEWKTKASVWSLGEITRVDVGGTYETALHAVGGDPPDNAKVL